jgi:hypothetical protein
MSGLFAVGGIYLTSKATSRQIQLAQGIQSKSAAYLSFLDKVQEGRSSVIGKIQYAGQLAAASKTDGEVQEVEDYLATLSPQIDAEFIVELNQEFNLLRTVGSPAVSKNVDDILYALAYRIDAIDISRYPKDVQITFVDWNPMKTSISPNDVTENIKDYLKWVQSLPYAKVSYFDEKVSAEQRFPIILSSTLFQALMSTISGELKAMGQ